MRTRTITSIVLVLSLLFLPLTAFAKKGDKNFKRGMDYEMAQQWDKAAQEFTLALAADPSNMEYQLHFRRASFNASQHYMQQGRTLAEEGDFVGAYNAFRQAYGYDPVNELAVSEMERMLRLQAVKEGRTTKVADQGDGNGTGTPSAPGATGTKPEDFIAPRAEQLRVIAYNGDLKAFIRSLAEQLNLNVIFDRTSFAQARQIDLNLRDVTTAQALDYVFLQEGLFFQKLSRRTILVADQARRPQYQQLVLRTFFLSNMKPTDARTLVQQAIPPSVGRPQTIVVPDDATNSLTVRDTAENVRLIGDLLASIDKDRAEVVMDVSIYEVSKTDMMQLGNQVGLPGQNGQPFTVGGSPGFSLLTDNAVLSAAQRGVNVGSIVAGVPTALAAALVIPPSVLTAFYSKGDTKLIASTQVHAFNGEESTARIGQRVPVQTAQAYPFGIQTGQPTTGQPFPSGGFPVINYEPTGLTLKFTPQVFPNLDVQVKMNIESKDVLGASTLTPTFTERTITGTARVQNNRTMMLASVSTDIEARGRQGLPVLGGLPWLGRFFTSPTRDNRIIDIVISVTPRVLRAPAVTPRDEEMRPSGTLQSPTTGSLEAMIREADRDDQIAAARMLPKNAVVQLPDRPLPGVFNGAPVPLQAVNNTTAATPNTTAAPAFTQPVNITTAGAPPVNNPIVAVATTTIPKPGNGMILNNLTAPSEELPSFVPAPKSLVSDRAATEVATVNSGGAGTQNAVLTSMPSPTDSSLNLKSGTSRLAQISFLPTDDVLKVGEKRRYAVQMSSDVALSLALFAIRFDPKVVKVTTITSGSLLGIENGPTFTQSVDPSGTCLISFSGLNGKNPVKGTGPLFFIDVEAIAIGDPLLILDEAALHLVATDAKDVTSKLSLGSVTVKQ
ncbi:MAG TPA: secretin N-terminal domain-containing protein [Pyrinomonadaceae bacterium]|nr:secretin N-terminal domain-containing protein [Pyrinomonadaceae bacterium]